MRMSISLYIFLLPVIFTLLSLFPLEKIEGHANPISYMPRANSTIEPFISPLHNVTIFFSEKPDPKLGFIYVRNSNNERIDNNDYTVVGANRNGAMVTLDVDRLSGGTYTVSWLTVSQDSGLVTKGAYSFIIK